MSLEKIDYKKLLKHLYKPSARKVEVVDVPQMNFLMVDGEGGQVPCSHSVMLSKRSVPFPTR